MPANQPVVVTRLGETGRDPMGGLVQDMSGTGMLMKLPEAVPVGALLRIETGDLLLLGEAVRCESAGSEFRVAVKVRHSLRGSQDLGQLNRALLENAETAPEKESPGKAAVPIMRE